MEQQPYCTVEEALDELRAGHIIVTIDDPDRENEGDLICAAQFATTENVNFIVKQSGTHLPDSRQKISDGPIWKMRDRMPRIVH